MNNGVHTWVNLLSYCSEKRNLMIHLGPFRFSNFQSNTMSTKHLRWWYDMEEKSKAWILLNFNSVYFNERCGSGDLNRITPPIHWYLTKKNLNQRKFIFKKSDLWISGTILVFLICFDLFLIKIIMNSFFIKLYLISCNFI